MKWQPIETAPKDGTPILGWAAETENCYETLERCWFEANPDYNCWLGSNHDVELSPTHWMPLPPAPEADDDHYPDEILGGEG